MNLPMDEARDFHCFPHVFENLGERSIPSDHAAVRIVVQIPANRCHQVKRIPSWMSKHPGLCLPRSDEQDVPDLFLNPFRHNLLLDPLCDLHLWNFLFFHLFLHRLEFYDILCRITC